MNWKNITALTIITICAFYAGYMVGWTNAPRREAPVPLVLPPELQKQPETIKL